MKPKKPAKQFLPPPRTSRFKKQFQMSDPHAYWNVRVDEADYGVLMGHLNFGQSSHLVRCFLASLVALIEEERIDEILAYLAGREPLTLPVEM